MTDSSGSAEFKSVSSDSYSFMASKSGYDSGSTIISTVDGKTSEATIVIKRSIAVKLPDGLSGTPGFPSESIIIEFLASLVVMILITRVKLSSNVKGERR